MPLPLLSGQVVIPLFLGQQVPQEKVQDAMEDLNLSLQKLEDKFLQDKPFLIGNEISLADLVAVVELMQVRRQKAGSPQAPPSRWEPPSQKPTYNIISPEPHFPPPISETKCCQASQGGPVGRSLPHRAPNAPPGGRPGGGGEGLRTPSLKVPPPSPGPTEPRAQRNGLAVVQRQRAEGSPDGRGGCCRWSSSPQPMGAGWDVFEGRPKLQEWRKRVEVTLGKELFLEAHARILNPQELRSISVDPPLKAQMKPALLKMLK